MTQHQAEMSPERASTAQDSVGGQETDSKSRRPAHEPDRFESAQGTHSRVGAHRISGKQRRGWIYVMIGLIATAVLVTAGILYLNLSSSSVPSWLDGTNTGSTETATPAVLDPDATVVVLNGTTSPGFGAVIDEIITENDWGKILFSGDADTDDVSISAVFYTSASDESAALGLAKELGGVSVFLNDSYSQYDAQLIVLLGTDYAGPGKEEFAPAS